ncbi:MAG TPA: molybdopterin oxidoreductase, partial [Bryobacteraceae bacterium]|nr:molybdopterin oxidoreductase [Bryobacteraceae bacterium]
MPPMKDNRQEFWRALEPVEETAEFGGIDRREFARLIGASLAASGLAGCVRQPPEHILPYVDQPEGMVQDKPLYFATAVPLPGYAAGLLVKSVMGRPIKIEGNPRHPATLGRSDAFSQASLLGL